MQVIKVRATTDASFFSLTNSDLNRAHEVLARAYALSRSNSAATGEIAVSD